MQLGTVTARPWRPQPRLVRGAYESGGDSQPPLVTLTTLGVAHPPNLGAGSASHAPLVTSTTF